MEEDTNGEDAKTDDKEKIDFRVDVSAIETVGKEQQAAELQSLNLDVYDLNTLEKGILAQVEEAIGQSNQSDICEDNLTEGEITDEDNDYSLPDPLKIKTSNKILNENVAGFPKQALITGQGFAGLQRYLDNQAKLQCDRNSFNKTKQPAALTNKNVFKKQKLPQEFMSEKSTANKKDEYNTKSGRFLGVKHKKKKAKLGTKVTRSGTDEQPSQQPGEENYMYVNTSGSEYVPSDDESSEEKSNRKPKSATRKRKIISSKSSEYSDDSDWYSNEDSRRRKKGKHELDDGDLDLYEKRIKDFDYGLYSSCRLINNDDEYKCPNVIWNKLYQYQQDAVAWFWDLNKERCGGILGDEMGLGKTIQLIAFLSGLYVSNITDFDTDYEGLGPSLIVCPTTLMHQWVREFHKWLPPVRIAILHDSGTYSGKTRSRLIDSVHMYGKGILITSYNGLVQFKDKILLKNWHYVILDEGHKIRNHNAQVTVVAKQLSTPHRIILSGSPLQNNLKELWSLFDFVYPGKLGTLNVFIATFQVPIVQGGYTNASQLQVKTAYKCATILKDTITPYLLRRMKSEVDQLIQLPPKTEQVLLCKLTEEQRQLYKNYVDNVDLEGMVRGRVKIFVGLINLRKICNHPDLYSGGPNKDFTLAKEEIVQNKNRFGYWEKAGKMIVIQTLLKIWNQQNHRVLLFTQSRKMLVVMEDFVKSKNYKYLKLDGGTSIAARQPMIDKFNSDTTYFMMLLTTKVGGLGVNLTGANRVVIYDPDWNPATDTQARERAWRIGQEKDVTIYRLITAGTIEEKMYHRQIFKQFLCNKVLKDPRQRRFFKSNDLLELFTLSETIKDGTNETSAIFAGTGSEVTVLKKLPSKFKDISQSNNNTEIAQPTFSPSKIEEMRKLAQQLSKKFSNELAANKNSKIQNNEEVETKAPVPTPAVPSTSKQEFLYGPNGNLIKSNCNGFDPKNNDIQENNGRPNDTHINIGGKQTNGLLPSTSSKGEIIKEHDKKKKHKHKSTFEGQVVPHLVRCKSVRNRKEKEQPSLSQDDYVLHKLFTKSGIETALKHDTIMEGGPSDYAIVEAEAEKVAQTALKRMRESSCNVRQFRKSFMTPLPNQNNGKDNLFSLIDKRNLQTDAGIPETVLLRQMISYICAQGGTASTDLIVQEFSPKVGKEKNAVFKMLLSQIAKFFRAPDKRGYWTIKDEFK